MSVRRRINLVIATFLFSLFVSVSFAQTHPGDSHAPAGIVDVKPGEVVRGQYIIVLNDNVTNPAATANKMARAYGLRLGLVYSHALKGFSSQVPAGAVSMLSRDPRVKFIEADQTMQAFDAQQTPTGISRIFAPLNSSMTIDGHDDKRVDVDVAVIDTGIDDHPDLNLSPNRTNCSGGSPLVGACIDGSAPDGNGHGTHVSGTIGALDNGIGVVGVAPGARLWGVKVLKDNGSGYNSWVIAGIDWVTSHANDIEVANMSLGGGNSAALCNAIAGSVSAGVTYVVAAGNSTADASTTSPANCPDVIAVSALADFDGQPGGLGAPTCRTDQDDTLADFSNFGSDVAIAAPGVCILSTWTGGGYNTISGTSMASPHVAGAAALLAASGYSTPAAIRSALYNTGNFDWFDSSGDGIQEPLLDVSDSSVFHPVTVANTQGSANTAPTAAITAPASGTIVSGVVPVQIDASDQETVAGGLSVTWSVDSGGPLTASYNSSTGYYEGSWDTTQAADGTHVIHAQASDGTNITSAPDVTVTVSNGTVSSGATTFGATSLSCRAYGHGKNLDIALVFNDNLGLPVGGANVSVDITLDGGAFWSPTGTTASDGSIVYSIKRGDTGEYVTTITGASAPGLTWDGSTPSSNTCTL